MFYEIQIYAWRCKGYRVIKEYDKDIFNGEFQYTLLSDHGDKVRVYKNGNVWKSNVFTGEYQNIYNFLESV